MWVRCRGERSGAFACCMVVFTYISIVSHNVECGSVVHMEIMKGLYLTYFLLSFTLVLTFLPSFLFSNGRTLFFGHTLLSIVVFFPPRCGGPMRRPRRRRREGTPSASQGGPSLPLNRTRMGRRGKGGRRFSSRCGRRAAATWINFECCGRMRRRAC